VIRADHRLTDRLAQYHESLNIRCTLLGECHPLVANTKRNLAFVYFYTFDYAMAEELYTDSLRILESTVGTKHLEYAFSLNDLALLYSFQVRPTTDRFHGKMETILTVECIDAGKERREPRHVPKES